LTWEEFLKFDTTKNCQTEKGMSNLEECQTSDLSNPAEPENIVELSPCPHCPKLEKRIREQKEQLKVVATLPATYIDGLLEEVREKHRKEVEIKLLKIQKLTQQIEKLQSKNNETQQLIQKYSQVEKQKKTKIFKSNE
jgi:hypothetical protein